MQIAAFGRLLEAKSRFDLTHEHATFFFRCKRKLYGDRKKRLQRFLLKLRQESSHE